MSFPPNHMKPVSRYIRIIDVPPGEAPQWVREKWVGLDLPLTRYPSVKTCYGFGVLSGPRMWWLQLLGLMVGWADRVTGYAVDGAHAIETLARSSPEAAAWWRENASQHVRPNRYLIFHEHVCRRIDT
jgi:hypothetical protein